MTYLGSISPLHHVVHVTGRLSCAGLVAEQRNCRAPWAGSAAVVRSCTISVRKAVLTMSTALASDWAVHRSDWLGFGMFSGVPTVYKGWNLVRVPPRARITPRQRGYCFNVWTLTLVGSLDFDCFGPGRWAGVGRDVGALVIEELDCLGVPERVDALPGVGSAIMYPAPRSCLFGCVGTGWPGWWPRVRLCEGRDRFRVWWLGEGCGVPCLSRGDPPGQALVRAFGVIELIERIDLFLELFKGPGEGLFVLESRVMGRPFLLCCLYGFPVIASIPREVTYVRSWP